MYCDRYKFSTLELRAAGREPWGWMRVWVLVWSVRSVTPGRARPAALAWRGPCSPRRGHLKAHLL